MHYGSGEGASRGGFTVGDKPFTLTSEEAQDLKNTSPGPPRSLSSALQILGHQGEEAARPCRGTVTSAESER